MTASPQPPAARRSNRRNSQRRCPRGAVRVECRKGGFGFGPNIADTFLDLSEGGLRLIVKTALDLGGEVEIQLSNYGIRKPIKRIANVCWVVPMEDGRMCVGISFQKRLAYRDVQLLASA